MGARPARFELEDAFLMSCGSPFVCFCRDFAAFVACVLCHLNLCWLSEAKKSLMKMKDEECSNRIENEEEKNIDLQDNYSEQSQGIGSSDMQLTA